MASCAMRRRRSKSALSATGSPISIVFEPLGALGSHQTFKWDATRVFQFLNKVETRFLRHFAARAVAARSRSTTLRAASRSRVCRRPLQVGSACGQAMSEGRRHYSAGRARHGDKIHPAANLHPLARLEKVCSDRVQALHRSTESKRGPQSRLMSRSGSPSSRFAARPMCFGKKG